MTLNFKYKKLLSLWLPAILLCLLIFTLSAQPGASVSQVKEVDVFSHKFAHFVIYFTLCLCFYRATKNILYSVIFTIFYGVTDELHQTFVITRNGNIIDIMVDSLGALTAAFILWKYFVKLPKPLKNWLKE